MTVVRSALLFALAALAEIGGAWLVWQGVREHRGLVFVGAGIVALGLYGFDSLPARGVPDRGMDPGVPVSAMLEITRALSH